MLEGCKWMELMRVGELVVKISQYGWMGWNQAKWKVRDKLGVIRFEGFIHQIYLFDKQGFRIQKGEWDLIDKYLII